MQPVLLTVSLIAAALYGVAFRQADPSIARVIVKTVPVSALAAIAALGGAPVALVVALGLCALGDAFLALDPKRGFLPGLASFLAGHIGYVIVFAGAGPGFVVLTVEPVPAIAAVAMIVFAGLMFLWLRPSLGAMAAPVLVYVAAIAAMAVTAFTLPAERWLAIPGALLFVASDAVLATELFKLDEESPAVAWTSAFVWAAYYLGQVLILAAFVPLT